MGHGPKLDTSSELDLDVASYCLTNIKVLRWMIDMGRMNLIMEVLLLSSHVAFPREHLEAYVMAHVDQRYNSRLVYDPLYPEIDHNVFKKCDWS